MLPVPDEFLDLARQTLARFTAERTVDLPCPDEVESQALVHPALFCRNMAAHVLSLQAHPGPRPPGEPERSVRMAAYYFLIATYYPGQARAVPEGLELARQGAWEFAMEVAVSA